MQVLYIVENLFQFKKTVKKEIICNFSKKKKIATKTEERKKVIAK